jgi:ribosomal protein L16 Arg81 hydroxylase
MDITGVKVYYKEADTTEETTTTTTSATDTSIAGTVLEINAEENTANIELDDGSSVTVPLDLLGDSIKENDQVNVEFKNGQPTNVTLISSGTTTTTTTTTEVTTTTTTITGDTSLGDVNLDGNIKVNDIQVVRQWLLHTVATPESTEQAFINADVTQDGTVRVNDIQRIRQYVLHIIDSLDE